MSNPYFDQLRAQSCLACGVRHRVEIHHIVKRSNGGTDDAWNLLALCSLHHTMGGVGTAWHQGPITFLEKFPHVRERMIKMGWEFGLYGKMFHPERHRK